MTAIRSPWGRNEDVEANLSRFDNLPTADLAERWRAAHEEAHLLKEALVARLIAESPVKLERAYIIKGSRYGRLGGRKLFVRYLRIERVAAEDTLGLIVEGVLKRTSSARDSVGKKMQYGYFDGRYTSKHVSVPVDQIDLATESDP